MMELDLLAIGPTKALVVEVKRRMDAGKVTEYREKLARLPEFFPELAGKRVLSAVASVYLEKLPSLLCSLPPLAAKSQAQNWPDSVPP
jgi:hypothetical protein